MSQECKKNLALVFVLKFEYHLFANDIKQVSHDSYFTVDENHIYPNTHIPEPNNEYLLYVFDDELEVTVDELDRIAEHCEYFIVLHENSEKVTGEIIKEELHVDRYVLDSHVESSNYYKPFLIPLLKASESPESFKKAFKRAWGEIDKAINKSKMQPGLDDLICQYVEAYLETAGADESLQGILKDITGKVELV